MTLGAARPLLAPPAAGSLPGILLDRSITDPRGVALRQKTLGRWQTYTWADYALGASRIGRGLLQLGVGAGDRVAVHCENAPVWPLADMAIQGIAATTVAIDPTSPQAEVEHLLAQSAATVVITDIDRLEPMLELRHRLPSLVLVVLAPAGAWRYPPDAPADAPVVTLEELEEMGDGLPASAFDRRVAALAADQPAVVVATSGTTGRGRGVVLTHANLAAAAAGAGPALGLSPGDEIMSYLPLSHVSEHLVSIVTAVSRGCVVNFPESPGTVAQDLQEIQPSFFLGVPRMWERLLAEVEMRVRDSSPLKRANYRFWMARGRRLARRRLEGRHWAGPTYLLGWLCLYRSLRRKLGLAGVRDALCTAAPIAPEVLEWFWSFGVPVREGYGLAEASGLVTLNPTGGVRIGTVGKPLGGVELRVAGDGEILTRSGGNFAGYLGDEATDGEARDEDGWLRTGDLGRLDGDGYLTVSGRKDDVIVTAGGNRIVASQVEGRLERSPYVKEAVVIGAGRQYLSALIGIERDAVAGWATRRGLAFTTHADLAAKPEVRDLVQGVVAGANAQAGPHETVEDFALLPRGLDRDQGELSGVHTVRRAAVTANFAALVAAMYPPG